MTAPEVPDWPELVVRMRLVEPPSLKATIATRSIRNDFMETVERLFHRPPGDLRIEDGDGRLQSIHTAKGSWFIRQGVGEFIPHTSESGEWQHPMLRPAPDPWSFVERTDVHRVLVGPQLSTVLDRPVWKVTLAPSRHKPRPLTIWIDHQYGFLLRLVSGGDEDDRRPSQLVEVVQLELHADLDERLFLWRGPVDESLQQRREQHAQAQEAARRRPPTVPRYWPTGLSYMVAEADSGTGSWTVDLDVGSGGSEHGSWARLDRRPVDQPPYLGREGKVHRWTDAQWQWALETDQILSDDELQRVIASIPDE